MKKFIPLFLISIIISTINTNVLAVPSDNIKFGSNITEAEQNSLSEAMIYELSKESGEVISIKKQGFVLDENGKLEKVSEISSDSTIPISDFEMTVAVQRIDEKEGKDNFKFVATGHWRDNPFYEFTDCIALAWSDEFAMYDDYGYTYSYNPDGEAFVDSDVCIRSKVVPKKGIAYDVDLKLGDRQDEVVLVAKTYKSDSSGEAEIVAEYGHVIIMPSSVSTKFSDGKSDMRIDMLVNFYAGIKKAFPAYAVFDY